MREPTDEEREDARVEEIERRRALARRGYRIPGEPEDADDDEEESEAPDDE